MPGLLRLHRRGPVQRPRPELWRRFTIALRRALAKRAGLTLKDLRQHADDLLRQGRRIPAARRRPLPRRHPPRRTRRTRPPPPRPGPPPTLLTDAIRARRPRRHRRPRPRRRRPPARALRWGASSTSAPSPSTRRPHRPGRRRLHRQVRHQSRRMRRHPRPPHQPPRRPGRPRPSATTPAASSPNCLRLGALDELADLRLAALGPHARLPRPLLHQDPAATPPPSAPSAPPANTTRATNDITTGRLPLFDEDTVLVIADWQYAGQGPLRRRRSSSPPPSPAHAIGPRSTAERTAHDQAPAHRPRGRRSPGHLPQQALPTARLRRRRLDPHRRLPAHPRLRPERLHHPPDGRRPPDDQDRSSALRTSHRARSRRPSSATAS